MREFARRNGVSAEAISRAVKAGRLPSVDGKIDPEQAQAVWDFVKDVTQVGRKLKRRYQPDPVDTENDHSPAVDTRVDTLVDGHASVGNEPRSSDREPVNLLSVDRSAGVTPPALDSEIRHDPNYVPPPTNGRNRIAITVPINGSEDLDLDAKRTGTGLSLPSYVITVCGYEQWRLAAARSRPERPSRRRPVRYGLERRSVTIIVSHEIYEHLWHRSAGTGLTLPQFIRKLLGFAVRNDRNPDIFARTREEDEAWERLQRLGLAPEDYWPKG